MSKAPGEWLRDTLMGFAIMASFLGVLVVLGDPRVGLTILGIAFCLFVVSSLMTIVHNTSQR